MCARKIRCCDVVVVEKKDEWNRNREDQRGTDRNSAHGEIASSKLNVQRKRCLSGQTTTFEQP